MSLDKSKIIECLTDNKHTSIESVFDDRIIFSVKSDDIWFDYDIAELFVNRYNGRVRDVLKGIFVDEVIPLKFCAVFEMSTNGRLKIVTGYDYSEQFDEYIPNPTLNRFISFGVYDSVIRHSLQQEDIEAAVQACVDCTGSISLSDNVVMDWLIKDLRQRGMI